MSRVICLLALFVSSSGVFADSEDFGPLTLATSRLKSMECSDALGAGNNKTVDPRVIHELSEVTAAEYRRGVAEQDRTKGFLVVRSGRVVKTPLSIVITHGLLNSPAWMNWLAKMAHGLGFNVINARLPDHFEGDRRETDNFNYKDAIEQGQKLSDIAEKLGDRVVYIGHSTGGAVSIFSAINNLDKTAGLVLYSPSLQVRDKVRRKMTLFSALGISGWLQDALSKSNPDPKNRYMSTYAGIQVGDMADELADLRGIENADFQEPYGLVEQRLSDLPILWFDTEGDEVIDFPTNKAVASSLNKTDHQIFPAALEIIHNATYTQAAEDRSPKSRALKEAELKLKKFLRKLAKGPIH